MEEVLILIIVVVGLFLYMHKRSEQKRGLILFKEATDMESKGQYANACFQYALTAPTGYKTKACRDKINILWKEHGPFDFTNQLEILKREFCSSHESCGEGYYQVTVSYIQEVIKDSAT